MTLQVVVVYSHHSDDYTGKYDPRSNDSLEHSHLQLAKYFYSTGHRSQSYKTFLSRNLHQNLRNLSQNFNDLRRNLRKLRKK